MFRPIPLLTFIVACQIAPPLMAGEGLTAERLRGSVDAAGRVIDEALKQQSGWEVIRGFTWRVDLEDPQQPGRFAPADPARTFHAGERFRISVEAFCDVYVYVLVRNADGSHDVLLPEPNEQVPLVRKGQSIVLPSDGGAFRFQPPGGTHRLRLIAAPVKLPWVDSENLFKTQSGQELSPEEENTLTQLKSVVPRAKGIASTVEKIGAGTLAKGCQVVLLEPAAEGNLVTLTSSDPTAKPILVHDVPLKQAP